MKRILSLVIALCLTVPLVRAEDILDNWHQWRGPEASGFAPKGDPPLKWDDKTNIKWKTELPGRGASTPIIWGDRVFLLAARDTGRAADAKDIPKADPAFETKTKPPSNYFQWVVLCLDRKNGKVLWEKVAAEKVPHEGHHPTHTYAASSPITDGKRLYVSFGSRGVFCYDLDGKLLWQRDFGLMHTRFGWGEGASPTVHGDSVIVPWDQEKGSFIVCLDAATGLDRWKKERNEPTAWATPLVVEHKGRAQVIVNATNRVRSYDLKTGEIIWECGGQTLNAIPSPIVKDGIAYVMSGYRASMAWAIPLDATGDVTGSKTLLWTYSQGTPYVPSALLADGRLWFTQANTSVMTCLDAKTGKPIIDRERLPGLTDLYASPVGAKDRIYFVGRQGTTVVLKRSDKMEVLATNRLGEPVDASPAVVGKQLFLRGEKHLYCIEGE